MQESGHVAQLQVTEGKNGEELLEVVGSSAIISLAHVNWCDPSLHACLDTYGPVCACFYNTPK